MNDLYLRYQFTDRAGRKVYNILTSKPTLFVNKSVNFICETKLENILGQIRITHGEDIKSAKLWLDWKEDE